MSIVPISVSTALVRMPLREGFGSSEFDGRAEITRLAGHILHVAVDFTDAHTGLGWRCRIARSQQQRDQGAVERTNSPQESIRPHVRCSEVPPD
ncbi:hypothetical protein BH11ACT6_BH11ACT6_25220 [soil metagenome]